MLWIRTRRTRQLLLTTQLKKIAFPTDGWGTALAKVHYLPVQKWTDIANSGKKHQNSECHSLPTGLRKAGAFLADEYDPDSEIKVIFIIAGSASTGSKI